MAEWSQVKLPPVLVNTAKIAEKLKDVIEAIAAVVDTISALLDLLKTFLVFVVDPKLALIKAILEAIKQALENLKEAGVFALFMTPDSLADYANNYQGGYPEFEKKFIQSLTDPQDSERPQIGPNGVMGGLFLFFSSGGAGDFLSLLSKLFKLLNRDFVKFPAPVNVKAVPADASGTEVDNSFVNVFSGNDPTPESVLLQWEEPTVGEDVFLDVFSDNKFYIEKSTTQTGTALTTDQIEPRRENPIERGVRREEDGTKLGRDVTDETSGRPVQTWIPVDPNDPFVQPNEVAGHGGLGFLSGSYSYQISDITKGSENGEFYRISSVPEDTELDQINGQYILRRQPLFPYTEYKPSSPVYVSLPDIDFSFDLPTALLNLYRAGYTFRMGLELRDGTDVLAGPEATQPALPQSAFDLESDVSTWGPIQYFSGAMFPQDNIIPFDQARAKVKQDFLVDPIDFDAFGGVDEFMSPRTGLPPHDRFRLTVDRLVEEKVEKLTSRIPNNDTLYEIVQQQYRAFEGDLETFLTSPTSESEFLNSEVRDQVASLLSLIEKQVQPGTPPNWESINFFEELFPEINDLFDVLFNILETLQSSFQTILDDIIDAIEGIQNKLEKITSLLELIEEIIDYILAFNNILGEITLNALWVPPQQGGTAGFSQRFMNASNKPDAGRDDFYSGIVLAFGGGPVARALQFIFGF